MFDELEKVGEQAKTMDVHSLVPLSVAISDLQQQIDALVAEKFDLIRNTIE